MAEQISQLQQIGVDRASAYGTPTVTFVKGLLASKFTANVGKQNVNRVPQVAGTKATLRVTKGPLDYDVTIEMPLDASAAGAAGIGDFLATLMGKDTASLVGGVATHIFSFDETALLPSMNLFSTKDYVHKQVVGFRANEMKFAIKSSDNVLNVTINGFAQDEADHAAPQTLVYSALPLLIPSDTTLFTVGGIAVANFEQIEITLKGDVERFRPIGASRVIQNAYSKLVSVEAKLTGLNFGSEVQRTAYKNVTTSALALSMSNGTKNGLAFAFPQCNVTAFEGPNISDADLMRINMTMLATGTLANETVTVTNDYAANYCTGASL